MKSEHKRTVIEMVNGNLILFYFSGFFFFEFKNPIIIINYNFSFPLLLKEKYFKTREGGLQQFTFKLIKIKNSLRFFLKENMI